MRAMKDSGIKWIGEIPQNWLTKKLKYCVDLRLEKTADKASSASYIGLEHVSPFTGTLCEDYEAITDFNGDTLDFCEGDVLFGKLRPYLAKAYQAKDNGRCSSEFWVMNPTSIEGRYLLYYVLSHGFISDIDHSTFGVKMPRAEWDYAGNEKMPLPTQEEQLRIVSFLDTKCAEIDALIAAKEKTNALLKERRQSIIYEAVTKGLDPTMPMKNSGVEWIGEIPEGWSVCRIKNLIDKFHPYPVGDGDHGMIKAEDYQDEGIPYIRVLNLTWGTGLKLDNLVYISEEMNDRIKNSELRPNDILIAKTGATIGKTAIVPESLPLSNTTSHVGKITISPEYDAKYFFYVMTSFVVQRQIVDLSSMQSTRPELGIDGLKNLIVTFPPVETQKDISQNLDCRCDELDSMIRATEDVVETLKEYRQSLIYEAITGKVEV